MREIDVPVQERFPDTANLTDAPFDRAARTPGRIVARRRVTPPPTAPAVGHPTPADGATPGSITAPGGTTVGGGVASGSTVVGSAAPGGTTGGDAASADDAAASGAAADGT
ncbi:hypothetical protein DZF91_32320, partial [Actinomadura logoneensis]